MLSKIAILHTGSSFSDTFRRAEFEYLQKSYDFASRLWDAGPEQLLYAIVEHFLSFLFFIDSPFIVLTGLLGIIFLGIRRNQHVWLLSVFFTVPILLSLPWTGFAHARGYLVYGSSIILIVCSAWLCAMIWRRNSAIGVVIIAGGILSGLSWSLAHNWGYLFPIISFYLGAGRALPLLDVIPTVMSMTGHESFPLAAGEFGIWSKAGMYVGENPSIVTPNKWGFMARIPFLIILVAIAVIYFPRVNIALKTLTVAVLCIISLQSTIAPHFFPITEIRKPYGDTVYNFPPNTQASFRVQLSNEFVSAVVSAAKHPDAIIEFSFIDLWRISTELAKVAVHFGGDPIKVSPVIYTTENSPLSLWERLGLFKRGPRNALTYRAADILPLLKKSREVTVTVFSGDKGFPMLGWQRTGLKNRLNSGVTSHVLPAFEIRVRENPWGALILAGF